MSKLTIAIAGSAQGHADAASLLAELEVQGHNVSLITLHCMSKLSDDWGATILCPQGEQLFGKVTALLGIVDLLVLTLPADQDVAWLVGMAYVSGVPVAVVREEVAQECCFSIRGCVSFWCNGAPSLLEVIAEWPYVDEDE